MTANYGPIETPNIDPAARAAMEHYGDRWKAFNDSSEPIPLHIPLSRKEIQAHLINAGRTEVDGGVVSKE